MQLYVPMETPKDSKVPESPTGPPALSPKAVSQGQHLGGLAPGRSGGSTSLQGQVSRNITVLSLLFLRMVGGVPLPLQAHPQAPREWPQEPALEWSVSLQAQQG